MKNRQIGKRYMQACDVDRKLIEFFKLWLENHTEIIQTNALANVLLFKGNECSIVCVAFCQIYIHKSPIINHVTFQKGILHWYQSAL